MKRLLIALAALATPLAAAPAFAHTSVVHMSIAEDARLAAAPENFTVEFSAPVGLAGVTLTDSQGRTHAVDMPASRQMAARHTIPLPALSAGTYTLSWRTIARDGHAMTGEVHFVVAG